MALGPKERVSNTQPPKTGRSRMGDDPAISELRMRLARGEITQDEFTRTTLVLQQTHASGPADAMPATSGRAPPAREVRPPAQPAGHSKAIPTGAMLTAGAVLAALFSFAPWYSVLGLNVNPWFISGFGATEWWLAVSDSTSVQGADMLRWVGPAIAIGLLLTAGGGATAIHERHIRLPAVLMATIGLGVYASATALAIFIAFKNGLDVGAWSFGLWGTIIVLLAMLSAGAFFSPEKGQTSSTPA